jgi:hypothetical protein
MALRGRSGVAEAHALIQRGALGKGFSTMNAEDEDNEYLTLPDDPEEAFAVLQRRKYNELEEMWRNNQSGDWYYERRYVDVLLAFDEVHDLGILTALDRPPINNREFADFFEDFHRHAEIASQKILIESARRVKTGAQQIITLDAAARQAIHNLISTIRGKLNDISLPENKREALFNKLNSFAAEVDRNRTRTEAFFVFAVETARVARDANEEIKPLQQTIDRLFDWIEKARYAKDILPPWIERKRIEPPRTKLADQSPDGVDGKIPV